MYILKIINHPLKVVGIILRNIFEWSLRILILNMNIIPIFLVVYEENFLVVMGKYKDKLIAGDKNAKLAKY